MVGQARCTCTEWPVILVAIAACLGLAVAPTTLAQRPGQPQYTIHARVPITIVDVTVTDAKGKPVHGLK